MKPFELFKAGTHTASGGATLSFSAADLQAAVDAYDPALHEAPMVVGHPKDNAPAWGWIKSLSFSGGSITAEPSQVDADFAEMVKAGRFKKRSASFYTPDAPNNPKPGAYYLRHVGFLGAQPPAVKGLKEVAFSDGEQGVVEFSDSGRWAWGSNAAKEPAPDASVMPAFNEDDTTMPTAAEYQATIDRLTAENAALKLTQKPADFSERETNLAAREAVVAAELARVARATVEARVDAAVKAGRLLPAQRKHAVDFAMGLAEADAVIDFGEGDKAKKVTQREAYLLDIESRGKVVEFGELARETGDANGVPSVADAQRSLSKQVFSGGKAA